MKRRQFFSGAAGAVLAGRSVSAGVSCGCALAPPPQNPLGADAFRGVGSRLKITNMKVFGVSLTPDSDRPFVFVKLETDGGVIGWGEGTLEGKAGAVIACMQDFRDFVIGSDPMQVEHHWQSMYVQSFYRAGPVMGSAISGIDQAMWDIRGKVLGDATVFGGNILVEDQGQVGGDTTSFAGDIRLDNGSKAAGDVTVFAGRLHRDPTATVDGDVTAFSGSLWLVLIFGLPLVLLGAFIALIVWLIWRLTHPAMPVTA